MPESDIDIRELSYCVLSHVQLTISLVTNRAHAVAQPEIARELLDLAGRLTALWQAPVQALTNDGLKDVEVKPLLASRVAALMSGHSGIETSVEGPGLRLPLSMATPIALAVNEALLNCLRHAFPNNSGRVVLVVDRLPDGDGTISVSDDGIGMEAVQPADGMRGLAIVGHLAAQVGAKIELDSAPGRGTTISFRIPASRRDDHVERSAREVTPSSRS